MNKYNLGDRVRYRNRYGEEREMTIYIIGGPYDTDEGNGIFYGNDEMELPDVAEEDIIDFA